MRSIQAKIFTAFSILMLIVIILVTLGAYSNSSNTIKNNAIDYISASLRHADENLQIMLEDVDKISTVVAVNRDKVADVVASPNEAPDYAWFEEKKELEEFLASLIAYKPYISRIAVIGLNGKTFQAGYPLVRSATINQPWTRQVLSENKRHLLFHATSDGAITIARPLYAASGTVGLVMIDFNSDIIRKIYQIQPLKESLIALVDSDGEIIYHSESALAKQNMKDTRFDKLFTDIDWTVEYEKATIDDIRYLVVHFRSAFTDWITIGMIPQDTLFQEAYLVRNQLIAMAGIVIFAVLLVSVFVSNQITKNLKRLRNTMKLVSAGHLSAKPHIDTKDEVGQLSDMFTTMMKNLQRLMDEIRSSEKRKREAEYKALQSQISPHFLYNTLNTIKYLAGLQHVRNIEEVSGSLVELLRNSVDHNRESVTIREELDYVKQYMTIQKYRYMETLSVVYDVEEETLACMTPKLILQPIVENSLIHGFARMDKPGLISIRVFREDSKIKLQVTDNGAGMTPEEIERCLRETDDEPDSSSKGIGLNNVNQRIHMAFGAPYGLSVISEPGIFTTVEITIPEWRGDSHAV